MRLYRFSPIKNETELNAAINHILAECMKLCYEALGEYLPVAGNVGVFCHYDDEYDYLITVRNRLTKPSDDPRLKYYELLEPIIIPASGSVPEATYTHLYIRKPDIYRSQVGDVDFIISKERYDNLKSRLEAGESIPGARVFPRSDLDMVELFNPDSDALGYASVRTTTEKVRLKTN